MKKTINLFVIPTLAGIVITTALHQFIGYAHVTSITQLDHNGTDIAFGLLGFLFGFLPSFIWGMAINWYNQFAGSEAPAKQVYVKPEQEIYIGKMITSPNANCCLRIKSINVGAILEFNNPDYQDYL